MSSSNFLIDISNHSLILPDSLSVYFPAGPAKSFQVYLEVIACLNVTNPYGIELYAEYV